MSSVDLPWPPASLSGHATGGHWSPKSKIVKAHRNWATVAAIGAKLPRPPAAGDIPLRIIFTPPSNRGDRTNYPNRMKPYIDGIADALGVNDRRFSPSYVFRPAAKPGGVTVEIGPYEQP